MIVDLHARAHHWVHYRPDGYLRAEVAHAPILASRPDRICLTRREDLTAIASQTAYYSSFAAPVVAASWLLTGNAAFFGSVGVVTAGLIFLAVHLHDAVHAPGYSPLERLRVFRWIDRHHYIHHVDVEANCNFVLPLGDLLLGTLRTELSQAELDRWPSYETVVAGVPARR
jgi:sterol desaturase/sphingolipid hydroxylase (fatty acid hydroxylase superfamily)